MSVYDASSFGEWLRQRRKSLDLTQAELARRAGCSKATIRKLESGELRPSKQLAELLAAQLEIPQTERAAFVRFARAQEPSTLPNALAHAPETPPWQPLSSPKTNLPIALTSFIGRAQEQADVMRLLRSARLLTLTGAGGIGKTRLALKVSTELTAGRGFVDGVWLVEFAQLLDSALVTQTVALALGVSEQAGHPLPQTLADVLRQKAMLLVFDNCEHLLPPIAALTESLLQTCAHLKVLATSREALAVPGEVTLTVPPLSTPGALMLSASPGLQPEAVQLFVDRARNIQPGFSIDAETAAPVAAICMRLDGIPLAIELAAARLRILSLHQIVAHLDDRFGLPTTGPRTALPRQQTLRATMDWSYELLPPDARILFRRLAVFAGGFTLEAAERVCGEGQQMAVSGLPSDDVLGVLARLVDQSLVQSDRQGEYARYQMLETIRQYGREKLDESGETERIQRRHFQYFLQLAESAEPHLSIGRVNWLDRLEAEHDNLRAALVWSRTPGADAAGGLRLAAVLVDFWDRRGHIQEGRQQIEAALAAGGTSDMTASAAALQGAARLAEDQDDFAAAQAFGEESIGAFRSLGLEGRSGLASVLNMIGYMQSETGNYATALAYMQEGLSYMRATNDQIGVARAVRDIGACLVRMGQLDEAVPYMQEAAGLFQQGKDNYGLSLVLTSLAEIALRQRDYTRALELEQRSLALRRAMNENWGIAVSQANLAWNALEQGDPQSAAQHLAESISLRQEMGDKGGVAWCLEKFASIAMARATAESSTDAQKHWEHAVCLFGAAAAIRATIGSTIDLIDRPAYEQSLGTLSGRLGAEQYAALWTAGQQLALDDAVEYALDEESS